MNAIFKPELSSKNGMNTMKAY